MSLDIQPSILNNQPSTINQLVLPIGINLENGGRTLQPDTASIAYDVTTGIVFYGSGSTWIPFESGSFPTITLTGNVIGSGTTTISTLLAPTINLPSSTANETLSFDASQTENQFILLNNVHQLQDF